jgi:hypothetical protein
MDLASHGDEASGDDPAFSQSFVALARGPRKLFANPP